MRASLEIHSGTLRVHADGGVLGDEYVWACGVTLDGTTAKLHGVTLRPTPDIARAFREELRRHGIKTIEYERRRDGKHRRNVSIPI